MEFPVVMFTRRPSVTQCARWSGSCSYALNLACGGGKTFHVFCLCDLDLDPMTFVYELDPYALKIYRLSENKLRK